MISAVFLFSLILVTVTTAQNNTTKAFVACVLDTDCLHGVCDTSKIPASCICDRGWSLARDGSNVCTYQLKSKLAAFLLSFFVGAFGADWFYLSVGNAAYIAAGVFKLLTLGGIGIWWLVDWIRILTNSFPDGQGVGLLEWIP